MKTAAFHVERLLWQLGRTCVAGVDEVGMGPLAGPVVAAAVVFSEDVSIRGLADSKVLTRKRREQLAERVMKRARGVGIGIVDVPEVDRLNVYRAGQEAMRRALAALAPLEPDYLLIDGREVPRLGIPQSAYPKGDAFVASIAAASIVAKVRRDAIMRELGAAYPDYGFERHMGYCTAAHLAALRKHGPSPVHRRSFAPVDAVAPRQLRLLGMFD
ncbi:MAG TPA: ribonuclease HII [Candidatus Limnocylindria bacterium]|nr:ribonuclease HII [Candidatus Limnocylindria bacterium]